MGQWIVGPGQGLPWPQALYPPLLWTTPFTAPTNRIGLSAGKSARIPAGFWVIEGGNATWPQWLDPVSREWKTTALPSGAWWNKWGTILGSDGFNFRIANLSGVATGAAIFSRGAGYEQATTHVTPSTGNSRWHAIVGGALGNVEVIEGGDNYSLAPTVYVPAPKFGRPAVGKAVLGTGGDSDKVVSVQWLDRGAGYERVPPTILLVPDLFDPNWLAFEDPVRHPGFITPERIRNARVVGELTYEDQITAVLLENFGRPVTTLPSLTIVGGTTAAVAHPFSIPQVPEVTATSTGITSGEAVFLGADDDIITIQPSYGT